HRARRKEEGVVFGLLSTSLHELCRCFAHFAVKSFNRKDQQEKLQRSQNKHCRSHLFRTPNVTFAALINRNPRPQCRCRKKYTRPMISSSVIRNRKMDQPLLGSGVMGAWVRAFRAISKLGFPVVW